MPALVALFVIGGVGGIAGVLWLEQSLRLPQGALQHHRHDGLPDEFDGLQRQQSRARGLIEIGADEDAA
jgi:hypothetical protein